MNERGPTYDDIRESALFPDIRALWAGLSFHPELGEIGLGGHRMMMMHLDAFASFRAELISALGYRAARTLITRIGYVSGCRDAEWARKMRSDHNDFDAFSVGPQLHALEGVVLVKPVLIQIDVEKGTHYGEFIWENSIEAAAVRLVGTEVSEPGCWMQIGYASGYTTAFMGRPILYRETECQSLGHEHCRIIGKPVHEWDDPHEDLSYMQSTTSNFRPQAPKPKATRLATRTAAEGGDGLSATKAPIVGASSSFEAALHKVARCAPTDVCVLIEGESGTGKERFAQLIHHQSERASHPFVSINCAAMPENLIEAELFGVEKGAFTGADKSRAGRFERAHKGTLFLDEIGLMPLSAQAKFLRVLQDQVIERVGGSHQMEVNVRIIAATNIDLHEAVRNKTFRQDLLYRLNVFNIHLPALRSRIDDIPILINHFIEIFSKKYQKDITGIDPRALDLLMGYHYPGNIRELQNIIERTVIMAEDHGPISGALLRSSNEHLARARADDPERKGGEPDVEIEDLALKSGRSFAEIERSILMRAVELSNGNLSEAARKLGLTRAQLAYRLEKQT